MGKATAAIDEQTVRVSVSMTLEQAMAMSKALDVFCRLGLGQLEIVAELVRFGAIASYSPQGSDRKLAGGDDCDSVDALLRQAKMALGFPKNGSFGIGHDHVDIQAARAYELSKVLDRALALYRDPSPGFKGVNYDGLVVRYTSDHAPVAAVTGGQPSGALYRAYWSPDRFAVRLKDSIVDHPYSFFSEERGYSDEERESIAALRPGERWVSDDHGEAHTVTRL